MPYPKLSSTTADRSAVEADAALLVVPQFDPDERPQSHRQLWDALDCLDYTPTLGAFTRVYLPDFFSGALAVVGAGKDPDATALRYAAGAGIRSLTDCTTVVVDTELLSTPELVAIAEGSGLGGYFFGGYKKTSSPSRPQNVIVRGSEPLSDDELHAANTVSSAAALVKDLVSTPAEWLSPQDFVARVEQECQDLPVDVEVWDERRLADEGFGGIIGVGKGSDRPPRLVKIHYTGPGSSPHISLVGKGITFDTGGLSLKPPASMVGMKYDMTGAATVFAVIRAAAELALPISVTAWLCIADNMPSGRATRPGDVLRIRDGQTVEVLNTDAEGRLVLADGLVAASAEKPDMIIDVATLTGAISIALGNRHTGVMGDDDSVTEYLDAAATAGELAWALPLPEHMESELDSPIADMINAKIGDPSGGSSYAGLFLRRFVGRVSDADNAPQIPWVHLDIAGTGTHKGSGFGFTEAGPTAVAVRSLLEVLKNRSHSTAKPANPLS